MLGFTFHSHRLGAMIGLAFFGTGVAFAGCYVQVSTWSQCCVSTVLECSSGETVWSCIAYADAGPFNIQTARNAAPQESGMDQFTPTSVGSCKRTVYACGSLPNECVEIGNQSIDCQSVGVHGNGCTGQANP